MTKTNPLPPALSRTEWQDRHCTAERGLSTCRIAFQPDRPDSTAVAVSIMHLDETLIDPEALHALAALCLSAQSFGFTHTDVTLLRAMIAYDDESKMPPNWLQHARDLAARIEALLCPSDVVRGIDAAIAEAKVTGPRRPRKASAS